MLLPGGRFMPICIEISSFVFVHKLVTDERTDGRTNGQVDNIMRPASTDK